MAYICTIVDVQLFASLLFLLLRFCHCQELLHSLQGSVPGENYTYYKIHADGHLLVELKTSSGDADLYVSDEIKSPQYNNYKLQSCTCGVDTVEIPAHYHRPIHVGVYGYPMSDISKYQLAVYTLPKSKEISYEEFTVMLNNYEAIDKLMYGSEFGPKKSTSMPRPGSTGSSSYEEEEEEEGNLFWQVFITLLKVIVEIML